MVYSIKVSHQYAPGIKIQVDTAGTIQELKEKKTLIQKRYGKKWIVHVKEKFKWEKVGGCFE